MVRFAVDEAKKKFQNGALSHGLFLEGSEIKSAKEDIEMLRSHALYTGFSENLRRYALLVKLLASVLLLSMMLFGVVFLYLVNWMEVYFGSWLGTPDPTWRKPFRHIWQFVPPRWEAK